ncbi:helix-turn-helix transcriptional regulator [Nocardioides caldifontis]|uniref:helix-turn-helix transcriptional regulator n=1 Tax=Nocardioides caldifontis TaxID=2588938 RepID=UPI0011E02E73|nr:response regulator transcription factor [Nocardioides caldifontis]
MSAAIPTYVHGSDPISSAGVRSQLRVRPEIRLVEEMDVDDAAVAVVVADEFDEATARVVRALCRGDRPRIVLVATTIDEAALVAAAEAGVGGLVRRSEATAEVLTRAVVKVAAGDGEVPPDLLGRLLHQVGRLQRQVLAPRGLTFAGLSPRETEVLRLVAEGHDTAEIAQQMCYSERTVKNVLHDLTTRLQLRNRTHAVAYAMREGLI